ALGGGRRRRRLLGEAYLVVRGLCPPRLPANRRTKPPSLGMLSAMRERRESRSGPLAACWRVSPLAAGLWLSGRGKSDAGEGDDRGRDCGGHSRAASVALHSRGPFASGLPGHETHCTAGLSIRSRSAIRPIETVDPFRLPTYQLTRCRSPSTCRARSSVRSSHRLAPAAWKTERASSSRAATCSVSPA